MKSPCIRNLEPFKKKGCPRKVWDGESGCPCWIEMAVANRENPRKKEVKKNCIDLWHFDFQWAMLGLLEGNQQATERFRNAMVQPDPNDPFNDNKAFPKPDRAVIQLYNLFNDMRNKQRIIFEHETRKQIE